MLSECLVIMRHAIDLLQGLLENPPPADSPHNIIICGDDQDAVTDAKQLTDCLPGFKVESRFHAIQNDAICKCRSMARLMLTCGTTTMQQQKSLTKQCLVLRCTTRR